MNNSNEIKYFHDDPHRLAGTIVNGVKTIMVNDPLRAPAAASPRSSRRAKQAPTGANAPPSPGPDHAELETADDPIIRPHP